MVRQVALLATIVVVSFSSAAFAQDTDRARNRGACQDDAQKLCVGIGAVMDAVPFLTVLRAKRTSSVIVAGNRWKAAANKEMSRAIATLPISYGFFGFIQSILVPLQARAKLKRNKVMLFEERMQPKLGRTKVNNHENPWQG